MMQNQYSNIGGVESLWNSHTVAGSSAAAAARFYQVTVTGGTVAATTTQAFNHDPSNLNRYMPSVAVDRAGNMAIGYSTSSSSARPAIQYAGRLASDPLNSLPQTETLLIQGGGAQTVATTRWGDYAALTLDPDGCRFWLTSQYYSTDGGNWNTRIGSFSFPPPNCTPVSNGTLQGTVTALAGGAPIAGATVALGARTATTDAGGNYSFSNLQPGTYAILTASAGGFVASSQNNVIISSGGVATQDFALATQPATACLTDTTQNDFQAGLGSNIDISTTPGSLRATAGAMQDQAQTNQDVGVNISTTTWRAQTFQSGLSGSLLRVEFATFCLGCTGSSPGFLVSIRAVVGGLPTGPDLALTSVTGSTSGFLTSNTATFASPATVTAGTNYAVVVRLQSPLSAGNVYWMVSPDNAYASGAATRSTNSGASWVISNFGQPEPSRDFVFTTFVESGFASPAIFVSGSKNSNPTPGLAPNWTTLSWNGSTPAGTTLRFQAAASENPNGPFNFVGPDGTAATFFTASGAGISQFSGFRYLKYRALLETSNPANTAQLDDVTLCYDNQATGPAANGGLQVGRVTLNAMINGTNRLTRVNFAQPFVLPPVVIVQPSNENSDPAALRVANVTRASFDILQVEAPGCAGCTGLSSAASVDWLAASEGSYRLRQDTAALGRPNRGSGPGPLVKVGRVQSNQHQRGTASAFSGWPTTGWQAVNFPAGESFSSPPVVLTTIQSWDNEGPNFVGPQPGLRNASQNFETTVSRNISVSGFELALEVSEVDDDDAGAPGIDNLESIGYVAIEDGVSANLVPLGGGSVGLATGFGAATGNCASTVLNGLGFPSAPSAPSLRGFAGKQTRSDSDGGWLRRCALTTPGGNAVSMTIDVDEDQDGDTERTHAASETVGAAIFGDDFITSPVSLAYAQTRPSANGVEFSFAAATEVGTLGYRLWGRVDEAAEWELL
ncbi:MAG: carboxypeptidase regulatory-like domain-containing protein, partial [Anaerolineae bacterium]|nr:carboxypeptidase regulatory-like domain-containing protein [Anaerolineae bacterium]